MKSLSALIQYIAILFLYLAITAFGCGGGASPVGSSSSPNPTPNVNTGQGGSLAQITIVGDYLYDLKPRELTTIKLLPDGTMVKQGSIDLPFRAETVFPFEGYLLIGAREGSYIYSLSDPTKPTYVSEYEHILACDPVVAEGKFAYVTLRSGTDCRAGNELHVLYIEDKTNPKLLSRTNMKHPHGLAVDKHFLMVCEAKEGISILNVINPNNPRELNRIEKEAYDVILVREDKRALVMGKNSLMQYDYSNRRLLKEISDYESLMP